MYQVFGYTDDCIDFEYTFNSFVEMVKVYRNLAKWCVVFVRRDNIVGSCQYVTSKY